MIETLETIPLLVNANNCNILLWRETGIKLKDVRAYRNVTIIGNRGIHLYKKNLEKHTITPKPQKRKTD